MHFFDVRNTWRILNLEPDGISHVEDTSADGSISILKNSLGKPGLDSCVNFEF